MTMRNKFLSGVSWSALSITWMQRYAAAIMADGIRKRGGVNK